MSLLAIGADAKTVKGESKGVLTGIVYLAPSTLSGKQLCAFASPGCIAGCLNKAGRGQFTKTQLARIAKTHVFLADPPAFVDRLARDIAGLVRKAQRSDMIPAVRLNGTSDLPWENLRGTDGQSLLARFPTVQFYDYTKNHARMRAFLLGKLPANYHLTFSRSECNEATALSLASMGGHVAVVFSTPKGQALPTVWASFPVLDGDTTDLRFTDPPGPAIVGLRAKGPAKRDTTGFVVRV